MDIFVPTNRTKYQNDFAAGDWPLGPHWEDHSALQTLSRILLLGGGGGEPGEIKKRGRRKAGEAMEGRRWQLTP